MTRWSRRAEAKRLAAAIAAAAALSACPAPAFREHGPRELAAGGGGVFASEQRAWERPYLVVSPADVLAGRPARFEVLGHVLEGEVWQLALAPEAGEPVSVAYRVADGVRLPLEVGDAVDVNQSTQGQGLMVRTPEGALVAVIAVDGALADQLEIGVAPAFDGSHLAYTEVVALPSGCMTVVDHYALELRRQAQRSYAVPGSVTRVSMASASGGEVAMKLYALDASRVAPRRSQEVDARCPPLTHVSWMLVRAP